MNSSWAPRTGLDLMRSSPALDELQSKLESRHKLYKLREALQKPLGETYGHLYRHPAGAELLHTRSALMGASGCAVPFDCDEFSRKALYTPWKTWRIRPTTTPAWWSASWSTSSSPRQPAAAPGAGTRC